MTKSLTPSRFYVIPNRRHHERIPVEAHHWVLLRPGDRRNRHDGGDVVNFTPTTIMPFDADHLLHGTLTSEGYMTWRLECLPNGYHKSWCERQEGCTCTCESCRDNDHGGCEVFGGRYFEEIGYECQAVEIDACWTLAWIEELGGECIHGNDWPEDGLPAPVYCEYDDGLVIRYCPPIDEAL